MELPFDYICFLIIRILKYRNMSAVVTYKTLVDFIIRLISLLNVSDKQKIELLEDFDFNSDLDLFMQNYQQYFEFKDDKFIFDDENYDVMDVEEILLSVYEQYEKELIDEIEYTIDYNVVFLDILGIKLKKELYHFLLDIEKKIEGLYFELMSCDRKETLSEREKVVKNIKTLTVTKRVLFLNMTHQLSYDEYYDLALYGDFYELSSNMPGKVDFSLVDDAFNEEEFFDNLIFRTLFVVDNSFSFNLKEKFWQTIKKIDGNYDKVVSSEIVFYLTLLKLLDREIENTSILNLDYELSYAKYKLMNALDTIYDTLTFMNKIDVDCYIENTNDLDYSFIKNEVYYFVKEILLYDDIKYQYSTFNGLFTYYDNVIKKLVIEAYYKLTKDQDVVSLITSNSLYGINTISSSLLDSVIDKSKKKIKNN